ncbi:MAG: hypoxanthine phosphoribosyltransferase, partial [Candidatus Scatosoma sp.]
MNENVERVMLTSGQIAERVKALAAQLDKLYEGRHPVVVCILKGSVMFFADLIREMKTPMQIDFMAVSSYGKGSISSGKLQVKKDLTVNISGKDVLIVEDIIDSGRTLSYLMEILKKRNPADMRLCTLLDKPDRRVVENVKVDYCGFQIPDEFVVGYGLDYAQKYRNLPYIGVVELSDT